MGGAAFCTRMLLGMHHSLLWLSPRPLPAPHLASAGEQDIAGLRLHDDSLTMPAHPAQPRPDDRLASGLARAARAILAGSETRDCQVLCLGTAAWIYVGGHRPRVSRTCRAPGTGGRARHKFILGPDDVVTIEGVRLTTEPRTVLDLLRLAGPAEALGPARCLLRDPAVGQGVRRLLAERAHLPGVRRAASLLSMLEDDLRREGDRPEILAVAA